MPPHRFLDGADTLEQMMQPVSTQAWTPNQAPSDNERRRLEHLRALGVLDTPRDALFQKFALQALQSVPGVSIAAVSLVDADRQWVKAIVGFNADQICRSHSFCSHVIQTRGVLVVPDATKDSRFAANPFVTGEPKLRFYAGIKLIRAVGALCVVGTEPRDLSPSELNRLYQLARFIDIQLLAGAIPTNPTR